MKPCLPLFSHIKRYQDPVNHCVTAKLLPGDFYVTRHDELITTVLGSCVSACIYDPGRRVGGMNHFMLPGDRSQGTAIAKYGLFAMESLINEVIKLGCRKENLRAKLFGGGQIIEQMSMIGRQNLLFAQNYLALEGIPVVGADVGLHYPRKVNFFPAQGRVLVKRLKSLHNSTLHDREKAYLETISKRDISGEIELF